MADENYTEQQKKHEYLLWIYVEYLGCLNTVQTSVILLGRPHRNKNDQVIGVQTIPLSKAKELSVLTIGRWKLNFFSVWPTQANMHNIFK